jgi:hypothetical protein
MCSVENTRVEGPTGKLIPGVKAVCSKCGDEQTAAGTTARSVRLCLVRLRENCEHTDENYYVAEGGEDQD